MMYQGKELENTRPPVTESLIRTLELELGANLPVDYASFLKVSNGCHAAYEVLINTSEYISYNELFGIDPTMQWSQNPFELKRWRATPNFPQKAVLPIAADAGGSTLFLDLRNGCEVVAFVHGLPEWAGADPTDILIHVADSFEAYWRKLTISQDYLEVCIEDIDPSPAGIERTIRWLDSGLPDWRAKYRDFWNKHVPMYPI